MDTNHSFLSGPGEIRRLMRERNLPRVPTADGAIPEQLITLLKLMLDSRLPSYLSWGADLQYFYNDAYTELIGDRHPDALGQPFWTIWPEMRDRFSRILEQVLQGESLYLKDVEYTFQRRGAYETAWFSYSLTPIRIDSHRIGGVFCTMIETTDKILAQRFKLSKAVRLRQMFDQAPSFMATVRGPHHIYESANPAYQRAVGGRRLINLPAREALPELSGQGFFELLEQAYLSATAQVVHDMAWRLQRTADGQLEEIFVTFVLQPIISSDGSVSGIFIEGSDVTEQHKAKQKLLEADQRKDEFLAMLAHELRNPLAPITAAAAMLGLPNCSADRVKRVSEVLLRQSAHLTALVDDLLDVSRVTRGLATLEKSIVDMNQVITDACEQAHPLITSHRHQFTTHLAPDSASVLGDRKRLVQALVNLLNNAARYTPDEGSISLKMEVKGQTVVLTVADSGIGMTSETVGHVFELFSQAKRSSDRSQGGLGIGLALAKSLVKMHDGTIQAHSHGLGQGSAFTISLPRAEATNVPFIEPATSGSSLTHRLRIMIVDDNKDAAEMLSMFLADCGHAVTTEHSAIDALARAEAGEMDVFILDIGLPDMDGNDLAKRLRSSAGTSNATLIAVTGYGQEQDRAKTKVSGFAYHLAKPVNVHELANLLDELPLPGLITGHHRAHDN